MVHLPRGQKHTSVWGRCGTASTSSSIRSKHLVLLLSFIMYTSALGMSTGRSRLAWAASNFMTGPTRAFQSSALGARTLSRRSALTGSRVAAWGVAIRSPLLPLFRPQQRSLTDKPSPLTLMAVPAPDSGEAHLPPVDDLLSEMLSDVAPVNAPPSTVGNGGLGGGNPQHDILVQDILGLPPEYVSVIPPPVAMDGVGGAQEVDPLYSRTTATPEETNQFVEMLRNSASYISMHRGSIMVLHLPGDLIDTPAFEKTLDDIALMSLLGVKIVLVCGVAAQVDHRLRSNSQVPRYCGDTRITDTETLRIVKEEAGFARCEVESSLSRGFKGRPGLMGINVVGGNFFYSAKPLGVIEGIDFGYTGEVRKVEADQITKRLDQGDVVLLTTLGYSASGQVFNVVSEQLASEAAAALSASKLIFITAGQTLVDSRTKTVIQSMRLKDAKNLLSHHCIAIYPATVTDECRIEGKPILSEIRASAGNHLISMLRYCRYSVQALSKGVKRAHLVAPGNGRLLQEIFTRDGSGTLISRDLYDGIRPATVADLPGILDIIQPLIEEGVLTARPQKELERDIVQYYVFTRDGLTVACGQLRKFADCAEIGCLAVHPSYRKGGRGDAMLVYLERIAVNAGLTTIFVLSTRTMQWFLERGFQEMAVDALPKERQALYNWQRRSKIYMKKLKTSRDLDAEELFMNV